MLYRNLFGSLIVLLFVLPLNAVAAVPGDYDGGGRSDIAVARGFQGHIHWYFNNLKGTTEGPIAFGLSQLDQIVAGDYNGDGRVSPGVVRDLFGGLHWFYRAPDTSAVYIQWGLSGDQPVTGRFFSSQATALGVVRNIGGFLYWYLRSADGSQTVVRQLGLRGDRVATGDLTGDGIDELIVVRSGALNTFYAMTVEGQLLAPFTWGYDSDELLAFADFDGDNIADTAVARDIDNAKHTFVRLSSGGAWVIVLGVGGDIPFVGDFSDHRGAELGVYRRQAGKESLHYIAQISDGAIRDMKVYPFGLSSDALVRPDGQATRDSISTRSLIPTIPPAASFTFNLDGLSRNSLTSRAESVSPVAEDVPNGLGEDGGVEDKSHFLRAVLDGSLITIGVGVHVALPALSLIEAIKHPAYLENDGWLHWRFNLVLGQTSYDADLRATFAGTSSVRWEMRLTGGALQDQLWYEGTAGLAGESGTWALYNLESGQLFGTSEWTVTGYSISIQFLVANSQDDPEAAGDLVTYSLTDEELLEIAFFDASESNQIYIEYNTVTRDGSVTDPNYNGGQRSYWDSNGNNIE